MDKEKQLKLFDKDKKDDYKPEEIFYGRCSHCKGVVSLCNNCNTLFKKGDVVYCMDTGENYYKHLCEECEKKRGK